MATLRRRPAPVSWQSKEEALERLLRAYQRHFDVQRNVRLQDRQLPAMASFHSRGEKYVLVKKATLWAMECHEHVCFFLLPELTAELLEEITELMVQLEQELVEPHSEHMYTWLSAVMLCDRIDDEAARRLKRFKWRRSYRFSLQGWCHVRLAACACKDGTIIANADGREIRKTLTAVLG